MFFHILFFIKCPANKTSPITISEMTIYKICSRLYIFSFPLFLGSIAQNFVIRQIIARFSYFKTCFTSKKSAQGSFFESLFSPWQYRHHQVSFDQFIHPFLDQVPSSHNLQLEIPIARTLPSLTAFSIQK